MFCIVTVAYSVWYHNRGGRRRGKISGEGFFLICMSIKIVHCNYSCAYLVSNSHSTSMAGKKMSPMYELGRLRKWSSPNTCPTIPSPLLYLQVGINVCKINATLLTY